MDISRLPVTSVGRPANPNKIPQTASRDIEAVGSARPAASHRRPQDAYARVVQGELLARERSRYQSTQSFIDERNVDRAQSSERPVGGAHQSRSAVSRYLNNTRPEAIADLTQGRAVNYFV